MEVIFKNSFKKDLRSCPKFVIEKVGEVVQSIISAKSLADTTLDFEKIKGQSKGSQFYKIRIGDYRIGIENINPTVFFVCVFPRGKDYKNFPSK